MPLLCIQSAYFSLIFSLVLYIIIERFSLFSWKARRQESYVHHRTYHFCLLVFDREKKNTSRFLVAHEKEKGERSGGRDALRSSMESRKTDMNPDILQGV